MLPAQPSGWPALACPLPLYPAWAAWYLFSCAARAAAHLAFGRSPLPPPAPFGPAHRPRPKPVHSRSPVQRQQRPRASPLWPASPGAHPFSLTGGSAMSGSSPTSRRLLPRLSPLRRVFVAALSLPLPCAASSSDP